MDFNATVDLIIRELNEAGEIIDDLKNYQGVPALQIELAKSKCKNAADVISLLKNHQDKTTDQKIKTVSVPVPEKKATTQQEHEFKKPEKPESKTESHRQEYLIVKDESRKTPKKRAGTVIIADTFDQHTESLNEKLGGRKDDDDVSDFIKSKPITRLSEAIGINDKFLFIRELFNGNTELYNKTISSLDSSGSFADASAIILNFASNDPENEAVKQLLDLVKRKFPADE